MSPMENTRKCQLVELQGSWQHLSFQLGVALLVVNQVNRSASAEPSNKLEIHTHTHTQRHQGLNK